jgi:xylulokinase
MPIETSGKTFIGIDIGTSSVKAIMARQDGTLLDGFSASHSMLRSPAGAAEQDPSGWMELVDAALEQFAKHREAVDVQAIGITSQVNTHVFCNAGLTPLHHAITWQDTRPGDNATELDSRIDEAGKIEALGAPIPIDASHALARMAWMARENPQVWAQTAHLFAPKDYAIACLTGAVSADPLASIGLVGTDFTYAQAILQLMPKARDVLPPLLDPLSVAGVVCDGKPFAGVPVAEGTMDAWAAMVGLGVSRESQAMYLSGTSEVMGLVAKARAGTPGVVVFPDWRDITLHAAPTQAGGASVAWAARLLGRDLKELSALAAAAEISLESPLFLPHLEGERAPLWDAKSRGGFAGLSSSCRAEELVASVMEGVAFSARLALEALELSGKQTVTHLRHGGGGASSDVWCQIRANALGRTLERVVVPEAGATGAMAMASVACGAAEDLSQATRALVAIDRVFEPDALASRIADERFEAYRQLYSALRPVTDLLADNKG